MVERNLAGFGPARDFVGYGGRPPRVRWPEDKSLALSIVVNFEEGAERSFPDGDGCSESGSEILYSMAAAYRDLAAESTWEYGSRAGVWRLLDLFREFSVPVTFFACAVALERNPLVAAALVGDGHEPVSHGWRFDEHWLLEVDDERARMRRAVESMTRTCGRRPVGWYCRYAPSVNTRRLLVEEGGFLYDSDAYNDDLPYFVTVSGKRHLVVPYSAVYNDSRFVRAQGFSTPEQFFDMCRHGIDQLRREGQRGHPKMMSIGVHPKTIGQAGRSAGLRLVLEYVASLGDVWIATREEIARWWLGHHEEWS